LALPCFAFLPETREFDRDFAEASGGPIERSDKTNAMVVRAASFLSPGRFTNILILVLPELCDYPMRALLVRVVRTRYPALLNQVVLRFPF
jgi:hypothetical protein